MKIIVSILTALTLLILGGDSHGQAGELAEIERISKSGATLDPEVTSRRMNRCILSCRPVAAEAGR